MAIALCKKCGEQIEDATQACPNCPVSHFASPFVRFAMFYFIGGLLFVALYAAYADRDVAVFVAANWLALGISVACIAYGLPRKDGNDVAGLIYIIGIAWLVLLFVAGTVLAWNGGIGVQELRWLLN